MEIIPVDRKHPITGTPTDASLSRRSQCRLVGGVQVLLVMVVQLIPRGVLDRAGAEQRPRDGLLQVGTEFGVEEKVENWVDARVARTQPLSDGYDAYDELSC